MVGRGFLDKFLAVNALGHSGGVVVALNKAIFSKVDTWMGQFSAAAKLKRQMDDFVMVVVSICGPANATMRKDLWRELGGRGVASTFQGFPFIDGGGGDLNSTLGGRDIAKDMRGLNPDSEEFWVFIAKVILIEMGLVDCLYMED